MMLCLFLLPINSLTFTICHVDSSVTLLSSWSHHLTQRSQFNACHVLLDFYKVVKCVPLRVWLHALAQTHRAVHA